MAPILALALILAIIFLIIGIIRKNKIFEILSIFLFTAATILAILLVLRILKVDSWLAGLDPSFDIGDFNYFLTAWYLQAYNIK